MKEKGGCAGGLFILAGIGSFVCSYFAHLGEESSKPSRMVSYVNGHVSSVGGIGGNSDATTLYSILFYLFIFIGIVLIISGIAMLSISSKNASSNNKGNANNDNSMFIICPKCGESNGKNNTRCYKCQAKLSNSINNHSTNVSEWKCPKCGRVNQDYVGTCGCGEVKPK